MSLIDILPRSANIRATVDSRILAFPKKELSAFFTQSPRVQRTMILNISRNLSLRLRAADAKIVALSGSQT
jgi:CRP-like cAMP-binding protein